MTLAKQWMARVIRLGRRIRLGVFYTPEGAARCYDKRVLHVRPVAMTRALLANAAASEGASAGGGSIVNPLQLNFPEEASTVLAIIEDERARGIPDDEALLTVPDGTSYAAAGAASSSATDSSSSSSAPPVTSAPGVAGTTGGSSSSGAAGGAASAAPGAVVRASDAADAAVADKSTSIEAPSAASASAAAAAVGGARAAPSKPSSAAAAMAADDASKQSSGGIVASLPKAAASGAAASAVKLGTSAQGLHKTEASAAGDELPTIKDLGHPTLNAAAWAKGICAATAALSTPSMAAAAAAARASPRAVAAAHSSAAALAAEVSAGRAALGDALVWLEHSQAAVACLARQEESRSTSSASAGTGGAESPDAAAAAHKQGCIAEAALALQDAFGLLSAAAARHACATSLGATVMAAVPPRSVAAAPQRLVRSTAPPMIQPMMQRPPAPRFGAALQAGSLPYAPAFAAGMTMPMPAQVIMSRK